MEWYTLLACIGVLSALPSWYDHPRHHYEPWRTSADPDHWHTNANPDPFIATAGNTDMSPEELVLSLRDIDERLNRPVVPTQWDESRKDFHDPLWQRARMRDTANVVAQEREHNDGYTDIGVLYASTAPIANSFGAEFGVVTKHAATKTVQRTGIGFYLRSDHLCNQKFDGNVPLA